MNSEEHRLEIERKILSIIEQQLKSGQMNAESAKEIAQYVISVLHSGISIDEIYKGVAKIGQQFTEFSQLAIFSKNDLEENEKIQTLSQVHKLLQEGNVNAASDLLKKQSHSDLSGGAQNHD